MLVKIFFLAIIAANVYFAILLVRKILRCRKEIKELPGNPVLLALYSTGLQFLAAFGVSDFSISIIVYRKCHLVEDEKLPGTLMTACVLPVAVMALGYLSIIEVDKRTLLVCVVSGLLGAFLGSYVVSRLSVESIKLLMGIALIVAGVAMVMKAAGIFAEGGTEIGFYGWKLLLTAVVTFILTALSMGGFAVTALLISFFYMMGLNPLVAFPLAMGTCSIACAFGGIRFIQRGKFNPKLALFSAVFGSAGAFVAVFFVRSLNLSVLQWLIAAVAIYSSISIFMECRKGKVTRLKTVSRYSTERNFFIEERRKNG